MENYVKAVGNLAYVVGFFLGIAALFAVYRILKRVILGEDMGSLIGPEEDA